MEVLNVHTQTQFLIAAGEKGVDLNCHVEDDWGPSSSVRSMSPLGIGPVLKDRSATNIGLMCLHVIH